MLNPALSHGWTGLAKAATFVPLTLLLIFALVLWKGGNKLRLISGSDQDAVMTSSSITPAILQSIAFSLAGVLVLAGAVAEIPNLATEFTLTSPSLWHWARLISFLIRLAFSLWLLLGAEGLRRARAYVLEKLGPAFDRNW